MSIHATSRYFSIVTEHKNHVCFDHTKCPVDIYSLFKMSLKCLMHIEIDRWQMYGYASSYMPWEYHVSWGHHVPWEHLIPVFSPDDPTLLRVCVLSVH